MQKTIFFTTLFLISAIALVLANGQVQGHGIETGEGTIEIQLSKAGVNKTIKVRGQSTENKKENCKKETEDEDDVKTTPTPTITTTPSVTPSITPITTPTATPTGQISENQLHGNKGIIYLLQQILALLQNLSPRV